MFWGYVVTTIFLSLEIFNKIMSANRSVSVLAPNGRRQNVKVSPNSTILQILEEVCKKQGFNAQEYDVRHHNKVLDATATVFYTGLPNNAQLELSPAVKTRSEGEVILAVNLESGKRLMGNFTPDNTLWDVLQKLCPEEANLSKHPVIIYMRNEVYGANLQSTVLRSLGLTGGRAMVRLIHRSPEELHTQPNVSSPLPSKPTEEKPYIRKFVKLESTEEVAEVDGAKTSPSPNQSSGKTSPVEERKPQPLQKQPTSNLVDVIKGEKKQKLDTFPKDGGHTLKESPKEVKAEPMETTTFGSDGSSFSDESSVTSSQIDSEFIFVGERNAMIFSMETAESVPASELPDDFFELTIDDARKILRDIKTRRHQLENGQLLTSALRKMDESRRQLQQLNRYKKAIIRIRFPDRTVLQGTFAPTDTIGAVIDFTREYLEKKNMDFYLYTTPPKEVLSAESRLIEIGCVPGALLHFGTNIKDDSQSYLRGDLMDKFTTNSVASLAAAIMRKQATRKETNVIEEKPIFEDPDVNVGASTSKDKDPPEYEDYEQRATGPVSTEKVPKWFKMAK